MPKLKLQTVLKEHGLKVTESRLEVLRLLSRTRRPTPAPTIVKKMRRQSRYPATTYRVLDDLKTAGLIRHLDFQQTHAYYELSDTGDHHHIVCQICRKVEGFVGCGINTIRKRALKQSNFSKVTQHSLELFGLCNQCQSKGAIVKV